MSLEKELALYHRLTGKRARDKDQHKTHLLSGATLGVYAIVKSFLKNKKGCKKGKGKGRT